MTSHAWSGMEQQSDVQIVSVAYGLKSQHDLNVNEMILGFGAEVLPLIDASKHYQSFL